MYGHSSFLSSLLPQWLSMDNFYVALAGFASLFCVLALGNIFNPRDRMVSKIKHIQERRHELQGNLIGGQKRKRPEASINFMRAVAIKLQLIKKNQIGKTESEL